VSLREIDKNVQHTANGYKRVVIPRRQRATSAVVGALIVAQSRRVA
jgi:hypothetical protein